MVKRYGLAARILMHKTVFFIRNLPFDMLIIWRQFVNYFVNRTTSGVMEGINNRIKLIMRQGYGFLNFINFRERVLACFSD
jgi:hypothetical protein